MNLLSLAARGIAGLEKFPDHAVSFDFSALADGVYAITGENGAGKSTVIELPLAALYGEFPSRLGVTLASAAVSRDACIDVSIAVEGRGRYRARVNIDGVGKATDAVLELMTADGLTRPLNDGKISSFRDAVARELPTLAMLLASAVAVQNKSGSFSDLSKKERRDLFAKLLGLEIYEAYAQTCREAAAVLNHRVDAVLERLKPLRAEATPEREAAIADQANALQGDLTAAEHAALETAASVTRLEAALETVRARASRYATALAERDGLVRRQGDRLRDQAQLARDRAAVDETHRRAVADVEAAAARERAVHEGAIAALESPASLERDRDDAIAAIAAALDTKHQARAQRIANNRDLLARAEEIRRGAAAHEAARQQLETIDAELVAARLTVATAERARDEARREAIRFGDAPAALQRAQNSAALIDRVPFGEDCAAQGCEFVVQAVQARASLPALEDAVAGYAEAHRALTDLEASVAAAQAAVRTLDDSRAVAVRTTMRYTADATLLPTLNAAQARVTELEAEQTQLAEEAATDQARARATCRERILTVGAVRTRHLQAIDAIGPQVTATLEVAARRRDEALAVLEARAGDLRVTMESIDIDLLALQRVLDETRAAHDELVTVETDLRAARQAQADADRRLVGLEHQVEAFEATRDRFTQLVATRQRLEAAVTTLQDQSLAWDTVARICGRDGLPVLEIDAAGPGVSALANDLLAACYGGRFVVSLVTQSPKADGKGFKEVFEVGVFDAVAGKDKDLAVLSGGERVLVDEAIRSAIALYVNRRNEMPIRTCIRDESIGSLDPDARLRYVPMLRRLRELGGFRLVLFVSHDVDANALADGQLVFAGGAITVRYPPFAASEAA